MSSTEHADQPNGMQRLRETRILKLMVAALALVTALVSVPLFTIAGILLLLLPFGVFVACCALVLPLDGFDRRAAQTEARLHKQRIAQAARHAIPQAPSPASTAVQLSSESLRETQAAMAAAQAHGIHFASAHLSDADFLHRFTSGELRAGEFRHGDHLRFAWLTLERLPYGIVEESIARALRQFLLRISGSNTQFHATHTHGWVRVLAAMPERNFAHVLAAHPDHLHSTALTRYWSPELLASDAARAGAVPTDVAPLPPPDPRRVRRYRQGNTSLPPAPYAPVVSKARQPSA